MPFAQRTRYDWKLRTRSLLLGPRTLLMGILNVTPDSFSDGGAFPTPAQAIEAALAMFDDGADIVDIGGESTRPGKRDPVSAQQEIDRVIPVLEGVRSHRPDSILSIDSYKSETAAAALQAGAQIVNDVLMHTRGRPEEWHTLPPMDLNQVKVELQQRLERALQSGVERDHIVLDPGFGFGKTFDQNYQLLARLEDLSTLGRPLLAGVSRKGFLGRTLAPLFEGIDAPLDQRGTASLGAATAAILAGAHLVRVHNIRPTREAAAIADALLAAS
jgi:dihydropteroate synthase